MTIPTSFSIPELMDNKIIRLPESEVQVIQILRGLSAIFWSFPLSLVTSVQVSLDFFSATSSFAFPVAAFGLMAYGVHSTRLLVIEGDARWSVLMDSLRVLALSQFLLSPFLLFLVRVEGNHLFAFSVMMLGFFWLIFTRVIIEMAGKLIECLGDSVMHKDFELIKGFVGVALWIMALGWGFLFLRSYWLNPQALPAILLIFSSHWLGTFLLISVILPMTAVMNLLWKSKDLLMEHALRQDYSIPGADELEQPVVDASSDKLL